MMQTATCERGNIQNTFAITESVLSGYINERLPKTRIDFLITQANEKMSQ